MDIVGSTQKYCAQDLCPIETHLTTARTTKQYKMYWLCISLTSLIFEISKELVFLVFLVYWISEIHGASYKTAVENELFGHTFTNRSHFLNDPIKLLNIVALPLVVMVITIKCNFVPSPLQIIIFLSYFVIMFPKVFRSLQDDMRFMFPEVIFEMTSAEEAQPAYWLDYYGKSFDYLQKQSFPIIGIFLGSFLICSLQLFDGSVSLIAVQYIFSSEVRETQLGFFDFFVNSNRKDVVFIMALLYNMWLVVSHSLKATSQLTDPNNHSLKSWLDGVQRTTASYGPSLYMKHVIGPLTFGDAFIWSLTLSLCFKEQRKMKESHLVGATSFVISSFVIPYTAKLLVGAEISATLTFYNGLLFLWLVSDTDTLLNRYGFTNSVFPTSDNSGHLELSNREGSQAELYSEDDAVSVELSGDSPVIDEVVKEVNMTDHDEAI